MKRVIYFAAENSRRLPALGLLLLTAGFPVFGMQEPSEPPARVSVSDEQVEAFAEAYVEVISIQEEYKTRIEATRDEQEAQQLQQEANRKMLEAIENTEGISLQEYNTILNAARVDEELHQRLAAAVQKITSESEEG